MELLEFKQQDQKNFKNSEKLTIIQKLIFENGWINAYKPIGIGMFGKKVEYLTTVLMPRFRQYICLLWTLTYCEGKVIIRVIMYQDSNSKYHLYVRRLIQRDYFEVSRHLNSFNEMIFNDNLGSFSILSPSPKIVFKFYQDFNMLNGRDQPYKLYFIKKLAWTNHMFVNQIQHLLQRFKILPKPIDTQEQIGIKGKLFMLKEVFEQNRVNRKWSSNVDLRRRKSKLACEQIKQLLFGKVIVNQKINGISQQQVNYAKYYYQDTLDIIKEGLKQQFNEEPHLMLTINILETVHETQISKGGFGKITKGKYICKFDKTVNQKVNQYLKKCSKQKQQSFEMMLCKKQCLKNGQYAFQNQKQILLKFRNRRCTNIAQYYCQTGDNFLTDKNIYLEAYNLTLNDAKLRFDQKIEVLYQLLKGLWFLVDNQIVHRDIKPQNLMLDNKLNLRIIDFGSWAFTFQSKNVPLNDKIYLTKGFYSQYNIYKEMFMTPESKHRMEAKQFYRHSLFDIFGFGKVLESLFNISYYEQFQQNYIIDQLKYLYIKCTQVNPADRLNHEEISVFLFNLLRLHQLQQIRLA